MPRVKITSRNLLRIGEEEIMFDNGKALLSEAIAAEKASGLTWPQILAGLQQGVMSAIKPVVWIMRKRSNPKLRFAEVDFSIDEYTLLDPDFDPDHWVVVADDFGTPGVDVVDIPDEPQDELPEDSEPEDPKADPSPEPEKG